VQGRRVAGEPDPVRPCSFRPFQARKTWFQAGKIRHVNKTAWAMKYCSVGPGLIKILTIPDLSTSRAARKKALMMMVRKKMTTFN
jgi:hypothetical protein